MVSGHLADVVLAVGVLGGVGLHQQGLAHRARQGVAQDGQRAAQVLHNQH